MASIITGKILFVDCGYNVTGYKRPPTQGEPA